MNEPCGRCEHPAAVHDTEYGCTDGWKYGRDGLAVTVGCSCQWAWLGDQ